MEVTVLLSVACAGQRARPRRLRTLRRRRRTLHDAAGRLRKASAGSPRAEDLELEAKRLEERGDEIAGGGYGLMSRKHMTFESRARKQRRFRPGS